MPYPNLSAEDIEIVTLFFNYVDTDGDGYITVEEIKTACEVDIDGDGDITEEERAACSQVWISDYLGLEDLDEDTRVTLVELLQYNNNDTKNQ